MKYLDAATNPKKNDYTIVNVILLLLLSTAQDAFLNKCKCIDINLERDGDSFGFTLRGGISCESAKSRPLTVTQIRPGGAADR